MLSVNGDSPVFYTRSLFAPDCWKQAFPAALILRDLPSTPLMAGLLWIHLPAQGEADIYLHQVVQRFASPRFIAISNEPSDDQGQAAFSAGASGYCNAHAAPEVLREVAEVVTHGGLWLGRSLLDRLVFAASKPRQTTPNFDRVLAEANLTEREREVTVRVANGVANKEVAYELNISERTVKAHLTAAFRKLGVRDRLQLAVLLNRET